MTHSLVMETKGKKASRLPVYSGCGLEGYDAAKLMAEKGIWWSLQPFTGPSRYPEGSPNRRKQLQVFTGTDAAYTLAKKYKIKTAFGTDILFSRALAERQGDSLVDLTRWYTPAEALIMATSTNGELLALSGPRNPYPGKLGVVENTATVHNVVVCTLCSCYPHDLLGDTPWWYKHDSYKKRIVADPRATLREMFQLELPPQMEIQVHDSTSDVRYMVLPRRPAGTEGMSEEELARLVTQASLIGAGECLAPRR